MTRKLNRQLVEKFRKISQVESNLESYENYYQAYVRFINEHKFYFTDEVMRKWGLDVLVSIDIGEYLVVNPDLYLSLEKTRMGKGKYAKIDTLAMIIRDTLWDMVTIYSGKDCPRTPDDELRYIKIVYEDNSDKILLECATCGWTEDVNGREYTGPFGRVFPVKEKEIRKYLK